MAPRILDEERYAEENTLTSILTGTRSATKRLRLIGAALPGQSSGPHGGTRFSFAAASYYSKNSDKESMWHMKWLSRLVRVRLDFGAGDQGYGGGQQTENSSSPGSTSYSDFAGSSSDLGSPEGLSDEIAQNNQQGFELIDQAKQSMFGSLEESDINDYLLH